MSVATVRTAFSSDGEGASGVTFCSASAASRHCSALASHLALVSPFEFVLHRVHHGWTIDSGFDAAIFGPTSQGEVAPGPPVARMTESFHRFDSFLSARRSYRAPLAGGLSGSAV
jgi:hypothetical protein